MVFFDRLIRSVKQLNRMKDFYLFAFSSKTVLDLQQAAWIACGDNVGLCFFYMFYLSIQ